jgi:hypothetical protein
MNPKTTPKDFFVHLGATVALYIAAGAIINLAFSIINYLNPDALSGYFSSSSIVWPVSMLVVLVPILYILEWLVNRDAARMPEKRDIWIRKWRIYLTLFLAVALIGGDLIALINVYLNGEITGRFIWKILAILVVAGVIGKYYFFSVVSEGGAGFFSRYARMIRRCSVWLGVFMVIAAIVGGFLIVGSPAKQRAIRFDQQRVNDLMTIQYQVINYWQTKSALPAALADLNDPISNFTVPTDPETKAVYDYSVKGVMGTNPAAGPGSGTPSGLVFELCATFALASQDTTGRGVYNGYGGGMVVPVSYPSIAGGQTDSWAHPAGNACFDRTIDPQRYPTPIPKPI